MLVHNYMIWDIWVHVFETQVLELQDLENFRKFVF